MFKLRLTLFLFLVLYVSSCSKKKHDLVSIKNHKYLSVKSFGAKGDGKKDDRIAIQKALDSGADIYFPDGNYLLSSRSTKNSMLIIRDGKYPSKIFFDKKAKLVISPNQPKDYPKPTVLNIFSKKKDIKKVEIDGISILGNSSKHNMKNTGVLAYSRRGTHVKELIVKNATFKDMGGGGIMSHASKSYLYNIRTENCGSHGIGFNNHENPGIVSFAFIDGYTSINDKAYSIDFSGSKDPKNPLYAYPEYKWEGVAKNITSKGSQYGIKTAGYWNLKLENILIEDSKTNGFFINIDAPGSVIEATNMLIRNSKGNALNLDKKSHFLGKNITIENAGVAIKAIHTSVDIQGLKISNDRTDARGIRIAKSVPSFKLTDFEISGLKEIEEYPIRIKNRNTILRNGKLLNNNAIYQILIYEEADIVKLENINFSNTSRTIKQSNAILNLQKQGKTEIINCDFSKVKGKKIDDRTKRTNTRGCKGL